MKRFDPKIVFFVLLLAVTMPPLVPGQQYTGVKSVESSDGAVEDKQSPGKADRGGGGSPTAGISARSIDKFEANELPENDSKIIKLSIKPIEPQVTSGSRGARNLGFSADVSLNSIPGGLNNELSNGDLKFSVTPSSTIAKDSYGNPVTPYTDLGTTGLEPIGFVPEANRDAPHGANGNQNSHLNFKLPSYASGIIEPVLLPPVAPVNFAPQQSPPSSFPQSFTTTRAPTTAFQFVPNAKIPTIGDGQITFAQKPLNGLIPPRFPGEELPGFKQTHHHHQQQPPVTQRPGQYVGSTFTGSFGGAPGLLGNQKQPGTHVKPDGSILPPSGPGIGFGSTTGSSSRPTSSGAVVATSGSTFTGSFGGPPGVLRPFDNVKG